MELRKRYLEALGSNVVSLSLSNITKFYYNYIKNNLSKVESEIDRNGYFVLKNKISIGDSNTTSRDLFISTYFVDNNQADKCEDAIEQKYHTDVTIGSVGGFFVPSTNEIVNIVVIRDNDTVLSALNHSDIRSTIEHEVTHAFDRTNRNRNFSSQKNNPGVGEKFLSACAYLGCVDKNDMADLLLNDMFTSGAISRCIYAISIILYKLFTRTEFNAHQMSDLDNLHKVNINRSDKVKKALSRDLLNDLTLTKQHLEAATSIDVEYNPTLWNIVGNVLNYMGYRLQNNSPESVYKFFKRESKRLFDKYYDRKEKNQVKTVISLREKNTIKNKIMHCLENGNFNNGITFWFSPAGNNNSYLCRLFENNGKVNLIINKKNIRIYGNVNNMLDRAKQALNENNRLNFEFAIDNMVDVIVQSIERAFNDVKYSPVYDITIPQDDAQINKSNQIKSRFADLDWD